jgi:hypothetical protein
MRVISLYTAANTNTNAAVTYQWLQRTRMDTIFASLYSLTAATALNTVYEMSIQSTSQVGTNDPIGVIATFRTGAPAIQLQAVQNMLLTPIGWQWNPVDRLYVHVSVSVAATAHAANFTLICNP